MGLGKRVTIMATNIQPLFNTEGQNVNAVLNVGKGANLLAIDNKIYLMYCGDVSDAGDISAASDVAETTTSTTTKAMGKIRLLTPNGGEQIVINDTYSITWESTESINDAVQIDLYQNDKLFQSIAVTTSNTGTYDWNVGDGFNVPLADDYKIRITWQSAGEPTVDDYDESNSNFSVVDQIIDATTTTTTTLLPKDYPDVTNCRGIPILELPPGEDVLVMLKDEKDGGILFGTSMGRILSCSEALVNAYLTGERKIYAEVKDGFGNQSSTVTTDFMYALYNKIFEVNEYKVNTRWKFEKDVTARVIDEIEGVFLSPILAAEEDFAFWKELVWRETKPQDTGIIICIRSADSVEDLQKQPWGICFTSRDSDFDYGSTGFIRRDIANEDITGKYLQFKVTMKTSRTDITPKVLDLGISYSTKFAVFFFTTRFALSKDADLSRGLLTASITEPQNTEVRFGVSNKETSNWVDYQEIEPNKFFTLDNIDAVKVGIKMVAYDVNIPEVAEFALMFGGDEKKELNS